MRLGVEAVRSRRGGEHGRLPSQRIEWYVARNPVALTSAEQGRFLLLADAPDLVRTACVEPAARWRMLRARHGALEPDAGAGREGIGPWDRRQQRACIRMRRRPEDLVDGPH